MFKEKKLILVYEFNVFKSQLFHYGAVPFKFNELAFSNDTWDNITFPEMTKRLSAIQKMILAVMELGHSYFRMSFCILCKCWPTDWG